MPKEEFFLSREALYIRIWETPTIKLAKEFGMSDVALSKICRKLEIPKPPLGYWRKIETGQKKEIPPLPKPKEGTRNGVWIYPKSEEKTLEFEKRHQLIEQNIADKIIIEESPENKITVSATLHNPHPLVRQTREALAKGNIDIYGAVHSSWQQKQIGLRVSKANLNRALRIMDALIKALEKRGCKVSFPSDKAYGTQILVGEIKIRVELREDFKRFKRELSAEEKKKDYVSDLYYFVPSGKFTFTIDNYVNTQRNWRDGKTQVLEDQLNSIVVGIFTAAEAIRLSELKEREDKRRRLEEEIQREKKRILLERENARRETLENLSRNFRKSEEIRIFLKACETKLIAKGEERMLEDVEAEWLSWGL